MNRVGRLNGPVVAIAFGLFLSASLRAGEVRIDGRTFRLPDGLTIERVAGPPLVDRPIVCDLDERGRLYVADSSGSNDNVQKQLAERPHRIVRLEDVDGDGRYDRSTVFADKMMFPEGAMWRDGSLYVAAPPTIWKLTDTDDDGVADRREAWFEGKTLTGCANDLHGPYPGPDGWIYWCKGAFAEQTYPRPGRPPLVTKAAHIFRARPDGTGIEPVMTGGMDNPVDVAFTPGGERVFTTTFLQHPGGGRRDGLIHAIYGGVYGKDHAVIEGHPRTGPDLMPVLVHLGPAAPCGLARAESDALGPGYRDNLFATLFNMHKVTRHVLSPEGASFATRDEDFLTVDELDFHPTDVQEDADGSLLIVDTGGWYKLCCPTSQLSKPDVLGAIYRVRKVGAPKADDPRGLKWDWDGASAEELCRRLDDARPFVRRRAVESLAKLGEKALPALSDAGKPDREAEVRRAAVWAACRIDHPDARALDRNALGDPDSTVRQAAGHAVSLWRDREALRPLIETLGGKDGQNRRVAAEALGRIGDRAAVPALLEATSGLGDCVLEHSIIFALIEIGDAPSTASGLRSNDAATRRAALIALDQMGARLEPSTVAAWLDASDPALKEAAAWVVGRHPQWGEALVGPLGRRLDSTELSASERAELEGQLARFARGEAVQNLLAARAAGRAGGPAARLSALRVLARAGLKPAPDGWLDALMASLSADDADINKQAVATARGVQAPKDRADALARALADLAGRPGTPADLRLAALAATPGGLASVPAPLFDFLRQQGGPEQPVASRLAAADVLSHAGLDAPQRLALAAMLKEAGPLEADRLLGAFDNQADDALGQAVLDALQGAPAMAGLRPDALRVHLAKFGPAVHERAKRLSESLQADAAKQGARLDELIGSLAGGDVRRGQLVFNGAKAACATCHAIGYLGGKVGPDLTRIGGVRSERDLLESIVYPSASFVRSYEPIVVATTEGRILSGVPKRDAPDEIVLAVNATEEARIPRGEIEEVRPGTVSVMPAGLDGQLTRQELADLIAFLKACR